MSNTHPPSLYSTSPSLCSTSPSLPSLLSTAARPRVIIVGAGIGGLTLGLLLEKAGVPYMILERTPAIKPLGSALSLGDNVAPLFHQLGIYEDFCKAALVNSQVVMHDENANLDYIMDFSPRWKLGGAELRIISRPALYEILYRRIPREKIIFGKRVLAIKDNDDIIQISCSDNSIYECNIVVGADGANSAIRQNMYRLLKEEGHIPASDDKRLPYNCICLVGQTPPLDPAVFPELMNDHCQFNSMCGVGKMYSWTTFSTKYKTLCWMVVQYLDKTTMKDHDTFRTSEWVPEAAAAMCNEVRDFAIPNGPPGSTLGTLIDLTPKELISKVALEEKVFKTWYSGRAVLLGDACHKLSPSGGVGATTAMHDAVCLANWINILPSTDVAAIRKIFEQYYAERFPIALEAWKKSRLFSTINAKNKTGTVARFVRRRLPAWLWMAILKKSSAHRPQVSFLPLVEDKGSLPPAPQRSLDKTLEILAARSTSP